MTTRGDPARGGVLITFEGPEGGGKTRQAAALAGRLSAGGTRVTLTREPGGTALGERIRDVLLAHAEDARPPAMRVDPRTEALLFNAARAQLVVEVIEPDRARGVVVVCARYADSTLAYQGYGAGLPLDELRALQRIATRGHAPDLTILLDLPVEVGLARKGTDTNRFEATMDLPFHRRVRHGFLDLAREEPARWAVIDAASTPDEVLTAVVVVVADRLPHLARALGIDRHVDGSAPHGRSSSEPEPPPVRTTP